MRPLYNSEAVRTDHLKLIFLAAFAILFFWVFFMTPALRPSSLLTILNVLLLSSLVDTLQKKGMPRTLSVVVILAAAGFFILGFMALGAGTLIGQWSELVKALPGLQAGVVAKLNNIDQTLSTATGLTLNINLKSTILKVMTSLQSSLFASVPEIASGVTGALILAPLFSFFVLKDSNSFRSLVLQLIPNRYFESFIVVAQRAGTALFQYLRAKMLEAILVGSLTTIGLWLIGGPYALLLGALVGVTNILPYIGPFLGALPVVLIIGLNHTTAHLLGLASLVIVIVNLIDMLYIFPIFVARLVNLSPLALLAAVAVGQELYGVVGMLIAVPVASCLKIIFQEVFRTLYRQKII